MGGGDQVLLADFLFLMRTEFYNHLEILKVLKTLYPKEREKMYLLDISDEYTKRIFKKKEKKNKNKISNDRWNIFRLYLIRSRLFYLYRFFFFCFLLLFLDFIFAYFLSWAKQFLVFPIFFSNRWEKKSKTVFFSLQSGKVDQVLKTSTKKRTRRNQKKLKINNNNN